jgi:hypothetical protein
MSEENEVVSPLAYGFKWGEVTVTRACQHKGDLILLIQSKRETLQVRVTPTGFIRTYNEQTDRHG